MGPATCRARKLDTADDPLQQVLARRPRLGAAGSRPRPHHAPRSIDTPPSALHSATPEPQTPNSKPPLAEPQEYGHAPCPIDTPPSSRATPSALPYARSPPALALLRGRPTVTPPRSITTPSRSLATPPPGLHRSSARPPVPLPPRLRGALRSTLTVAAPPACPSVSPGLRELCPRPFSVPRPNQRCEESPEMVTVSTLAPQKPCPGPLPGQLRPQPSWKWEVEGGGRRHGAGPGMGSRAAERIDRVPLSSS